MRSGSHARCRRRHPLSVARLAGLTLLLVAVGCLVVAPAVSASPAPEEPRHGLDNETFHGLWSKTSNGAYPAANTTPEELRNRSDVSFKRPPDAVETWNTNEYTRFPSTGSGVSVWPNGTSTVDDGYIKDAYVELFAVSPSTTVHRSPGDTVTYVPQNGTVIAHADFRYDPPPPPYSRTSGSGCSATKYTWYGEDKSIKSVAVNGNSVPATDTIYYNYTGLSRGPNTISVSVTFFGEITKKTESRVCPQNAPSYWTTVDVTTYTDEPTVTDAVLVSAYDPIITGFHSQLNHSTTDVEVGATAPWQGVTIPGNESIRTNWRYFAARDTAWDNFSNSTNSGGSPSLSLPSNPPAQPLQTHAYPSSFGPIADTNPFSATQLLNADGPSYTAPSLPSGVDLDTVNGSYTATAGFAFRSNLSRNDNITAHGIVNGYDREIPVRSMTAQHYTNTTLNATITNQTSSNMTVRFNLTANGTGNPIDTSSTSGHIEIGGKQVDTNASGIAVATVANAPLPAEYQPSPYYETINPYRPSSAYVVPEPVVGSFLSVLNDLFMVVFLFGLFFMPLFILDRILDADVWPPWKEVWRELF